MANKVFTFFMLLSLLLTACQQDNDVVLSSPDGSLHYSLDMDESGLITYSIDKGEAPVIVKSLLGLHLLENARFTEVEKVVNVTFSDFDETWKPVWGPNNEIVNEYNQAVVTCVNTEKQTFKIYVRLFNDGVGFRYEIPTQSGVDSITVMNELTQFNFAENGTAWSIPANYESYEMLYSTKALDKVSSANTPMTVKMNSGAYVSIHEANLTDYAGMTLYNNGHLSFSSDLVPWRDGTKVKAKGTLLSPWRTIMITDNAAGLVESNLIQNLNDPCVLKDTEWIEPMKYIGIWWGMHLGVETWTMGENHGATTANMKRYIDFAAANNVQAVLAEGWNTGWEHWGRAKAFDQMTPYADYDFDEIVRYAKSKNVEIIGHHETGGDYIFYEEMMEKAFADLQRRGIRTLKTGYAGGMPDGEFHHSQPMVRHYRKVVETAAKYNIMINAHEPIKATGISRTYPNMMTREGARGMEWNGWSAGNPAEHHLIIPFTRCLGGPIDYTPGTFDILYKNRKEYVKWNDNDKGNSRVNTTISKQLALWVTLYSPLQMASDLVSNYEDQPAFEFFSKLPAAYDESKVLAAEIGDYYAVARRNGDNWYLGATTDENARVLEIDLSFLDKDKRYRAYIFADSDETTLDEYPEILDISERTMTSADTLTIEMISSGGQAIVFEAY